MFNIPKKYNWRFQKIQDCKKKDLYIFEVFDKKANNIIQRRSTRSAKAMVNKIKKLIKIINLLK